MKRLAFTLLAILAALSSWAAGFSKPDTLRLVFYVKPSGSGDGSSWEKAMGNDQFIYTLAHARRGATFHLAAGKYVPVFSQEFEETKGLDKKYQIEKSATIIGGYPVNPTKNDTPDPKKTLLSFLPTSKVITHLTNLQPTETTILLRA